jgi:hypothetical protein
VPVLSSSQGCQAASSAMAAMYGSSALAAAYNIICSESFMDVLLSVSMGVHSHSRERAREAVATMK